METGAGGVCRTLGGWARGPERHGHRQCAPPEPGSKLARARYISTSAERFTESLNGETIERLAADRRAATPERSAGHATGNLPLSRSGPRRSRPSSVALAVADQVDTRHPALHRPVVTTNRLRRGDGD